MEPNDAMRANGIRQTEKYPGVQWFACMWNHRDLDNPLQEKIEAIIQGNIPGYEYGARREDQTPVIDRSGLFKEVRFISGQVTHQIKAQEFIEGWKSHGTVYRQSPEVFQKIIENIRKLVEGLHQEMIAVPYTTRIWTAQKQ